MAVKPRPPLSVHGPQRVGFDEAYERQLRLWESCAASQDGSGHLMLVEHPPTITVGRSGSVADVLADESHLRELGVALRQTNRGGEVTFHGPGQLIAYPIIDLRRRGRDLRRYLRELEAWLVRLCRSYGVDAHAESPHTGVWVGERKIASIGIAARRWVCYHGVALNVDVDLSWFHLIVPCGLHGVRMTSLREELAEAPPLGEVAERAADMFTEQFGFVRPVGDAARDGR